MSILDEIVLLPPPMRVLSPLAIAGEVAETTDAQPTNRLQRPAPWVIGNTRAASIGTNWKALCERCKTLGLVIECTSAEAEALPANIRPDRMSRQNVDQPLSAIECQSAALIEIACQSAIDDQWAWPPELGSIENLSLFVHSIREAMGQQVPIGLGLPVGVDTDSIEAAIRAEVGFLSLHATENSADEITVETLVRTRNLLQAFDRSDVPILLRAQCSNADHLIKWIALGASLVTIDAFLADALRPREQPTTPGGFLQSVQAATPVKLPCPILAKIQQLNSQLQTATGSGGMQLHANLRKRLRATTSTASRFADIPLLGS